MKIKIPLLKTHRYIDLMGDPIHQNKVASTFLSQEFAGASVAIGINTIITPHNAVGVGVSTFISSMISIGLNRFILEKSVLGSFSSDHPLSVLSKSTLEQLAIDKNPSQAQCMNSLMEHGHAIKWTRNIYAVAFIIGTAAGILDSIQSPAKAPLTDEICYLIRFARGLYRYNKLLSGEWAIVAMPDKQEKIDTHLEFDIPEIKLPTPAHAPARNMG